MALRARGGSSPCLTRRQSAKRAGSGLAFGRPQVDSGLARFVKPAFRPNKDRTSLSLLFFSQGPASVQQKRENQEACEAYARPASSLALAWTPHPGGGPRGPLGRCLKPGRPLMYGRMETKTTVQCFRRHGLSKTGQKGDPASQWVGAFCGVRSLPHGAPHQGPPCGMGRRPFPLPPFFHGSPTETMGVKNLR